MVKHLQTQNESLYGLPQPTVNQFPTPVVARRDPAASDTGYILGQIWVNRVSGTFFGMASVGGGVATWLSLGGSLTPAVLSLTTGAAATSTLLAGDTWSATGTNAAIDLTLTPKGAGGVIVSTGALTVTAGDIVATLGNVELTAGNLLVDTAGDGIQIAEGANARMGQDTLVGGTITVNNTSITANTRIFLSRDAAPAGAVATGNLCVQNVVVGTSFDISAVDPSDATALIATDTSTVNWLLIEAI